METVYRIDVEGYVQLYIFIVLAVYVTCEKSHVRSCFAMLVF